MMKSTKLSAQTKIIRIDSKTQIEVSTSISDDDARERYYSRHVEMQAYPRILHYPLTTDQAYKMPPGSQERLADIVDEVDIPDEE
jgi:hypothetical protein